MTVIKSNLEEVKVFYKTHAETNWTKRYQSPYLLRRYFFRTLWQVIATPVQSASLVLDAGCGDGVLSVLMALWQPQQRIIAMDISEEAVKRAKEAAIAAGVADRLAFVVGDAELMPFKDNSIPAVVSCHVLEHLPDFDRGVQEIHRVLQENGIGVIGLPTCLNISAMVLLGGDNYWRVRKRTAIAFWLGAAKVFYAWIREQEGVNEGYRGQKNLPHLRRFPWKAIERITSNGLKVEHWMADSLLIPYLAHFLPSLIKLQEWIDCRLRKKRFWRNLGAGIVMVVRKWKLFYQGSGLDFTE